MKQFLIRAGWELTNSSQTVISVTFADCSPEGKEGEAEVLILPVELPFVLQTALKPKPNMVGATKSPCLPVCLPPPPASAWKMDRDNHLGSSSQLS